MWNPCLRVLSGVTDPRRPKERDVCGRPRLAVVKIHGPVSLRRSLCLIFSDRTDGGFQTLDVLRHGGKRRDPGSSQRRDREYGRLTTNGSRRDSVGS